MSAGIENRTAYPLRTIGRRQVVEHYGDPVAEYQAATAGGGICDRADRAVLRVTGKDRAAWLHNLTTNQVKELSPGEWRYAFVLNVKGRILFDLNLLVDDDCIWLDLDDRVVPAALSHFSKYTITEDVSVEDVSDQYARFTVLGEHGVARLGEPPGLSRRSTDTSNPQVLYEFPWRGSTCLAWSERAWRIPVTDLIVPTAAAPADLWKRLTQSPTPHTSPVTHHPLTPIGWSALETHRIESGLPASVSELNEEALPAETGQLERAVSFKKGCYLGQEVVERMRAHKSLARKLVGIALADPSLLTPHPSLLSPHPSLLTVPASMELDGKPVGTLTSVCHSPRLGCPIGLGYVRVAHATAGTTIRVGDRDAQITNLPF